MGKNADLIVVQKTLTDPLKWEGNPAKIIAGCWQSAVSKHKVDREGNVVRKCALETGFRLQRTVKQGQFKNLGKPSTVPELWS